MSTTGWFMVALVCAYAVGARADVVIETVTVGNAGNTGEPSGQGDLGVGRRNRNEGNYAPERICGGVDYTYNIGKYEVTAGQYTAFLNAVAATDTYGLYNTEMWSYYGCMIERSGSPGSYAYSVAGDWANRPANYVSWGDAARFANWLHNGQPTGEQGLSTTEDGSYFLNGAKSNAALLAVKRKPDATWVIPSEDEWYKAAYHKKNKGVTGKYFAYPTSSDTVPSNLLINRDPGNNATFYDAGRTRAGVSDWTYTIGSPYYRTEVGEHEKSASPYGTFDQGGNVYEWNETVIMNPSGTYRGVRGGCFYSVRQTLHASGRGNKSPTFEDAYYGFRVAFVPSPLRP